MADLVAGVRDLVPPAEDGFARFLGPGRQLAAQVLVREVSLLELTRRQLAKVVRLEGATQVRARLQSLAGAILAGNASTRAAHPAQVERQHQSQSAFVQEGQRALGHADQR